MNRHAYALLSIVLLSGGLWLFAILITACAVPVGVTIDGDPELLDDAADILGVSLHPHGGPICVTIRPRPEGGTNGTFVGCGWCCKTIESVADPITLAHEIGHAFGLDHHSGSSTNLMAELISNDNTDLTDRQRDRLADGYAKLARCP